MNFDQQNPSSKKNIYKSILLKSSRHLTKVLKSNLESEFSADRILEKSAVNGCVCDAGQKGGTVKRVKKIPVFSFELCS